MEISGNSTLEIIPTSPVTLAELMKLGEIKVPIYKTSIDDFYRALTFLYQNKQVSKLDGSVAVCIGGGFRSPRVNSNLYEAGVIVSKSISRILKSRGLDMLALEEAVRKGKINDEGYLHPYGFPNPLKNLFVTIDIDKDSSEPTVLYLLVREIDDKFETEGKKSKLNVIVIPGEENELIRRGKRFEDEVLHLSSFK